MTPVLHALTRGDVEALADAIDAGRMTPPFHASELRRVLPESLCAGAAAELRHLLDAGMSAAALALTLRLLAREKAATQRERDRVQLVWSGPTHAQASLRDTGIVVADLLGSARQSVLIASFAVYEAQHIFAPLAARMDSHPALRVRMFLNVARPHGSDAPGSELLRRFLDVFCERNWPGRRLPEIFYDPRALDDTAGPRASLHAKCIVVDGERALVTSANFTEAAQQRNIEAGVLVEDSGFARTLRRHFEALVETRVFLALPGTRSS
jgi:phosphatidylserine/phosphatidylglycerophosphate/cardiolipin synthase-like enzyme